MPSPHVGDEKDKRAIVYKSKEKEEKGIGKKKIIRACLKKLMAKKLCSQLQLLYTKIQYLSPRFRLAFSPALYKFIVWVIWTQIHPYSGSKSNLVLAKIIIYIFKKISKHGPPPLNMALPMIIWVYNISYPGLISIFFEVTFLTHTHHITKIKSNFVSSQYFRICHYIRIHTERKGKKIVFIFCSQIQLLRY